MVREGYKETELGEIPVDWEILELRLIVKNTEQITPERTPNKIFKYIDVSSISRNLLKIKSYSEFIGKFAPSRARKQIKANDIIFSTIRPYLKQVSLIDGKYNGELCSTAFCVIRCDKEILSPSFCFFYMTDDNFIKGVSKYESGSNYPAVLDKDIKNQLIILPPLPEQHRIAAVLSTIDETIEKTERLIGKLKMEKAGLMADLLTKGIDEDGRVRSEETHEFYDSEIGRVPVGWAIEELGKFADKLIVPMRDKPKKFDGDIPWCRIEDFEGKYLFQSKSKQSVSNSIVQKMNLKIFPIGTIICSCSATLGICAIAGCPLITNQTFIGIVPGKSLDKEFIYYLMSYYANRLQSISTGTTISYLPREKFESFLFSLPSLPEQQRIASILTAADDRIEKEEAYRDKLVEMKKGLMADLLTGKVRVPEGVAEV